MRVTIRLALLALLLLPPLAPGLAGPADRTDDLSGLADDLRGVRQALDRLVELLERQEQNTRVGLLLDRIALQERRLTPLDGRLRSTENEIRDQENNIDTLEAMLEQQKTRLDEEIRDGADQPRSETRRMIDDIERSLKSLDERLEVNRMLRQVQESDLSNGRRELAILDDMLLELLEDER